MCNMVWKSIAAQKREARDAAIAEGADALAKAQMEDLCDFDPARTNISFVLEQLGTGKLSTELLVSATIHR